MASSSSASSVKYPYPDEVNVKDLVPDKLSKDNYFMWKTIMFGHIESQGLLGFINGEVSAPPEWITVPDDDSSIDNDANEIENQDDDDDSSIHRTKEIENQDDDDDGDDDDSSIHCTKKIENQDYQDWKRSDKLLQEWITETISEDVIPHVVCCRTAKDMWSKLTILRERKMDYPYLPIDINVTDFVPIKLSGSDNYSIWKTLMVRFIESQGLLGFINGEVLKIKTFSYDNNSNKMDEWRKSDKMLQRWIKETINEDIRGELVLLETSKDIWKRLSILHKTNIEYPYPIEVNVDDFVPLKLSRSNYLTWRRLMLRLFENQGLLGFIMLPHDNNSMSIPRAADSLAWKRTDALLQSWILRTITENFLAQVMDTKTVSDMWTKLESLFTSEDEDEDEDEDTEDEDEDEDTETIIDYPYPVEVNVGDFVPVKLMSEENYHVWDNLMFHLIKRQGLVGFINGDVPAPPRWITISDKNSSTNTNPIKKAENPDYMAWKRTDLLLQSWILGTINKKDLFSCLVDLETAQDIWTMILKVFDIDFFSTSAQTVPNEEAEEDRISKYLPLHKAALTGDWEKAKEFITQKPEAARAFITREDETALMVAISSVRGNHFVKNLLQFMSPEDLAIHDKSDWTALNFAAMAGNTEAAKLLVDKNPLLPNYCGRKGLSPLVDAAQFGRRKMIDYLLGVTKENVDPKPFEGRNGCILIKNLILGGLYDMALSLIKRYPKLAWEQPHPALKIIALNCSSAFKSGAQLNRWQHFIYPYVPMKLEGAYHCCGGDIENPTKISFLSVKQKLHYVVWKVTLIFVPQIKYIQEIKLKHEQALQLVKHLCSESLELNYPKVKEIIERSLVYAVNYGIPEVVEEIIKAFPGLVHHTNEMKQTIFHIAILNRCEDIFNLIYQFREEVRHFILTLEDSNQKSCLDLVVDLKNEQKLDLRASAAGAALQMQRELQWFKEVEKHAIDFYKGYRTKETTTTGRVYTETHEELVKEGEKWMKDTATSCTIIAALVATVVFAAAITVPGGNDNQNGIPILFHDKAFIIFILSDALALFSSISSVVMFLSILTSRYSVTDFHFTLPNRLIIGLTTLFVSLISMMVAFDTTLYLIFEHKITWILFPVIVFSCIPVVLFAYSQFPLLLDMIISTYGPGIFSQQSDCILF